jgi:hypothetical protein
VAGAAEQDILITAAERYSRMIRALYVNSKDASLPKLASQVQELRYTEA